MPEKFSFPEKQRGATTQKSPQYFSFSSTLLIFFRQVPATHTHTHSINAFYLAWIGGGGETSVCVHDHVTLVFVRRGREGEEGGKHVCQGGGGEEPPFTIMLHG